ncbi:unnamed protein product [Phytophthora lilii]|uniref:Unnamed protein product n=1 Tax=Phytophthora lilii TaxID=2077276 RepID=A0A9W6TGB9_9STRA|nr:unnamed protein product [Phytophthora lilii]
MSLQRATSNSVTCSHFLLSTMPLIVALACGISHSATMGSDAKAKAGSKRLHEDEDEAREHDEGADVQPLDVLSMQQLLESMGADKFEPRVVAQLQEFVHRTPLGSNELCGRFWG